MTSDDKLVRNVVPLTVEQLVDIRTWGGIDSGLPSGIAEACHDVVCGAMLISAECTCGISRIILNSNIVIMWGPITTVFINSKHKLTVAIEDPEFFDSIIKALSEEK